MTALGGVLLARVEAVGAADRVKGTPTSSWLASQEGLSKREAAAAVFQARDLERHQLTGQAAVGGRINIGQARAISGVLNGLGLEEPQQVAAEQALLDLASTMDAGQLAKAGPQVLRQVDPGSADEVLEQRLQRQAEAAHRNRGLRFVGDGQGSIRFSGSLPKVEGEAWLVLIRAYQDSQRRNLLEERDRLTPPASGDQRRADALIAMIQAHQLAQTAPASGGDRPRVMVVLDYHQLQAAAAGAGLIGEREPISASQLRQLCCDADLLPVVLGGPSEILDVGRTRRLVTPAIRAALTLRDGGCVFPHCDTVAVECEAHHIRPWWAGGVTALSNLVLLCRHHHGLIEPAKFAVRDQWEVRIRADGIPELIPPTRMDPQRKPVVNARFEPGKDKHRCRDERLDHAGPGPDSDFHNERNRLLAAPPAETPGAELGKPCEPERPGPPTTASGVPLRTDPGTHPRTVRAGPRQARAG